MVYVLRIEHRHDCDVSSHSTEGKALKALDDYVKSNWGDMFHDSYQPSKETPLPKTRDDRIEDYFEKAQRIMGREEFYEIHESEVDANE